MKIHRLLSLLLLLLATTFATAATGCWKQIAVGADHTIAVKNDGTLWAWGGGNYGQLGNGTNTGYSLVPIQITTTNNWKQVFTSGTTSFAIQNNGTLWAWGYNGYGQYGNGTTTQSNIPLQIGTATDWKEISSNSFCTIALKTNGTLWAWGDNGYGMLGDGTTTNNHSPSQIGTATNWKQVSAGIYHCTALKTDGTLWAWGYNGGGSFGTGNNTTSHVPVQMGTLTTWTQVAAGHTKTMAIKTDGSLWVTGSNSSGQFGNGTDTGYSYSWVRIGSDNNWAQVDNGFNSTIALKTNGTLWSWGQNSYGNLGIGTTSNAFVPTQIGTATTWSSGMNNSFFSGGVHTDGTIWMFGHNNFGTLGNNSLTDSWVPVAIGCPTSLNTIDVVKRTITVYPNPVKDEITLEGLESESDYVLYNAFGQVIQSGAALPNAIIKLGTFAKGLYYLSIENTTLKLIKE